MVYRPKGVYWTADWLCIYIYIYTPIYTYMYTPIYIYTYTYIYEETHYVKYK